MIDKGNIENRVAGILSTELAWHFRAIPIKEVSSNTYMFFTDDTNIKSLKDEMEIILDISINYEIKSPSEITDLLNLFYPKQEKINSVKLKTTINSDNSEFLYELIEEAKIHKSSDIHIECYEEIARIRIRIDGMLIEKYTIKKEQYPSLINKIKIMANMDIAEKRLPQDGRILFQKDKSKFDLRISVLPTMYGEKVVMRLLNTSSIDLNIASLGFNEFDLANFLEGIKKPNGIILISGPTGSGKTTTLYSVLNLLNKESRNILTIEDPIEYTIEGINQVQLKENIGFTFSSALRTFLRQDPDVIMVGEIRDVDTAAMAIRAALTGHLVLSTIHTNSAWGTVSRLIDMGIQPFLLANTLNTSAAQRLVRLLCVKCKRKEKFDKVYYPRNFSAKIDINYHYVPNGCEYCQNTGYKGRKAIYEVIPVDYEIANLIKTNTFNAQEILLKKGILSLADNAFQLFEFGETSIEEIYPLLLNN